MSTEFLKSNPDLINTSRAVKLVVTASIGHLEELLTRLIDGSMLIEETTNRFFYLIEIR